MRINPVALFLVAFTTLIGHLFFGSWQGGAAVGIGIVLFATFFL